MDITHGWLLWEQERIAEQLEEPVFITIKLVYDGYVAVEMETPDGLLALSRGWELADVLADATKLLLTIQEMQPEWERGRESQS